MAKITANPTVRAQDDKHLNDPTAWFQGAENIRKGAAELFRSSNPLLWFPAALLGHQALEMFLKAALIRQGSKIGRPPVGDTWGHQLMCLGKQLTANGKNRLPDEFFEVLQIFDDYFTELRYPRQLRNVAGLGEEEGERLEGAIKYLLPYAQMPKLSRRALANER